MVGEFSGEGPCWGSVTELGEEEGTSGPLHEHWGAALRQAADSCDEEGWYKVETFVYVKRRNPGWVDGFRVHLTPPDA